MRGPWYLRGVAISYRPTRIDKVGCDGVYIKNFDGVGKLAWAYLLVLGLWGRFVEAINGEIIK